MESIFEANNCTGTGNSNHEDSSSDNDDEVIDFLNVNCSTKINNSTPKGKHLLKQQSYQPQYVTHSYWEDQHNSGNLCTTHLPSYNSANYNNNMIPTINVTSHTSTTIPVNKYNNLFEDTLNQLQSIRESIVKIKNSTNHLRNGDCNSNLGNANTKILSTSLPDLTGKKANYSNVSFINPLSYTNASSEYMPIWPPAYQQRQYDLLNACRRNSWTGINDASEIGDGTNKSISLSSLDCEEQDTIRSSGQRCRSTRNSTGGISTHSLNEAELVRDFEHIVNKRNLATELLSRIPLQKSISTSSIVANDDIKAISRHLTDSDDENQSLLRTHRKIEVYDNIEKRRKRGSLFFRKKKDKTKMKSIGDQSNVCDICGTIINLNTQKDHQIECRNKKSMISTFKKSDKFDSTSIVGTDCYDGTETLTANSYNDDTPLIRTEFLNETPIEAQDLCADPILGIELKEYDSWSPGVSKDILKTLKETQIKRQEHMYEFIMTEKHHCQTLLVMQKVFVESLERHFPGMNCTKMFPRLNELTNLHIDFLKKLRLKQRECYVIDSIADVLLDFFSLEKAQHLRLAYGEFCANHRTALEQFKSFITGRDPTFSEWYKHCLTNPLLKKKGIPECILFVTQRLTKYPLLIEPLLKSARDDKLETDKLQHALSLVKDLLVDVDACVAEKELRDRQVEIYNRIDPKSFAIYKNKPYRKHDVGVESRRRLKFEGVAALMQGRSKVQLVLVVVLTDCLCFLIENSAHNKYTFFTPEHKAGVVPLQKLLIREKAGTESRGIYIISSNPLYPEMYELKVQTPKDKNIWIQTIRQAVLDCPSSDMIEMEDLTAEEKLRIGINKREIIEKIRQKDIEQALLLEEKIILQLNLMQKDQKYFPPYHQETHAMNSGSATNTGMNNMSAAQFLATYGSYRDLIVGVDCDIGEIWQKVINTVQEISQLAMSVYTAATGQPVSRSISSVGEKKSELYAPIMTALPKRAETFAGFDEKRSKNSFLPTRESNKLFMVSQCMRPRLQELEEKKEIKNSSLISSLLTNSSFVPNLYSQHTDINTDTKPTDDHSESTIQYSTKENNMSLLQITHNLHTLLCIISQQMTTIHSLQLQLALYRDNSRTTYAHNDQLEELRNLQDKLQEEKTAWMRRKEQEEQELAENKASVSKLQEQMKAEQEDIKQQREQLYRKMEILSSQGLLISPNTPLMITSPLLQQQQQQTLTNYTSNNSGTDLREKYDQNDNNNSSTDGYNSCATSPLTSSLGDRRKDKWRTASTITKTPPVNLLSATNAPKIQQSIVKQQIPIKLSSLSSSISPGNLNSGHNLSISGSKIDKTASFNNTNNSNTGTSNHMSSGITQMFPLKLSDKRSTISTTAYQQQLQQQQQQQQQQQNQQQQNMITYHSRTGSSPAIIQQAQLSSSLQISSIPSLINHRTESLSVFVTSGYHYSNSSPSSTNKQSIISELVKTTSIGPLYNMNTKSDDEEEIYF